MHAWEQIQLVLDDLEDHLDEELDIEKLSRMAALSPFYFQRLFSRLVRKSVAEYVKLRRMAKAAESLLQKDRRILDIALELGFSSHEHFTRTFKNTFGMTPNEYRSHPQTFNRMTKPELSLHYVLIDEGVPLVTEGIVLEINRQTLSVPLSFAGFRKKMPVQFVDGLGTESGVDPLQELWQRFHAQKETSLALPHDAKEIGVTYPCSEEGFFYYFAGGLAEESAAVKKACSWTLPQGEYIVCSFEAENFEALVMDALYKAQQYLFSTWLPSHQLQTEPFCAERYASNGPGTTSMEIWLKTIDNVKT